MLRARHASACALALALVACGSSSTNPGTTTGTGSTTGGGAGGAGGSGGDGGPACATDVAPGPGTVVTDRGAVAGKQAGTTWAYLGIPYAAPPTGALRFHAPEPHACWQGALPATSFGQKCLQLDPDGQLLGGEDCLTLDVWTPKDASPEAPAPVLFFIHGGGNTQGSASEQIVPGGSYTYDGQALAEARGAVVVTIQYRIQAAGWLTLPELDAESPHAASGNNGTLDQIAALGWVQRNIRAFGGDPARVLLFGESAGAVNTCAVLSSPLAKGLFSAALMESGGCTAMAKAEAQAFGATLVEAAGCKGAADVPACLRALAPEALVKALPVGVDLAGKQSGFQPHVDGWALPATPEDALAAGKHNHVPLVVGVNGDETGKSVGAMDEAAYEKAVLAYAGGLQKLADEILAQYPASAYPSPRAAYVALTSDAKFVCTARRVARAAAKGQTEPVYRYYFTHALQNAGPVKKAFGAFHGLELLFVFQHLSTDGYAPTAAEAALATAMGGYWARFGATGDPDGDGAPSWPKYDPAKDTFLRLDDTIAPGEGVRTAQCDFWDSLAP